MFANTKAFSGFAVDDLEAAKKFYGETLGLSTSEQYGLLTLHLAGGRDTLVYPKPDHVPAGYTILNFQVDDIDAAVGELSSRGVPRKGTTASGRTRTASTGPGGPTSPGSRTRRGTSWRCCRSASPVERGRRRSTPWPAPGGAHPEGG